MGTVEERVREFLETWAKRKTGELSAIDMRVNCQSCGVQVLPGESAAFDKRGILCRECWDKGNHGTNASK